MHGLYGLKRRFILLLLLRLLQYSINNGPQNHILIIEASIFRHCSMGLKSPATQRLRRLRMIYCRGLHELDLGFGLFYSTVRIMEPSSVLLVIFI